MARKSKSVDRVDTALERTFDTILKVLGQDLPTPIKNYRFDEPDSRMEIDRYWQEFVGVEICGGTWSAGKSGHSSGNGIDRDYRKLAAAHRRGIKLFFFSTTMLRDNPEWCIEQLRNALKGGCEKEF
jgi:hypothetical protein